jgi:FtsZ-interacting cell division protein ZipA
MALYGDMVWFVVMSDDTAADGALAAAQENDEPTNPRKRKPAKSQPTQKKKPKPTEPESKLFVTCIKQSNNQTNNKSNQTIKQSNKQQIHIVYVLSCRKGCNPRHDVTSGRDAERFLEACRNY